MKIKSGYISFGDICTSRYWLSVNWCGPIKWWRWWLSFDKTYNGTTHGLHIGLPFLTVLGHRRAK